MVLISTIIWYSKFAYLKNLHHVVNLIYSSFLSNLLQSSCVFEKSILLLHEYALFAGYKDIFVFPKVGFFITVDSLYSYARENTILGGAAIFNKKSIFCCTNPVDRVVEPPIFQRRKSTATIFAESHKYFKFPTRRDPFGYFNSISSILFCLCSFSELYRRDQFLLEKWVACSLVP